MFFERNKLKMSPKIYIVLVNILCEIMNLVYVNAEALPSSSVAATFDVSDDMGDIAEYICEDLQFESDDTEFNLTACQDHFLSSKAGLSSTPPAIQVCRLDDSVLFNLSTTDALWRLVVLVPDDDTVTDMINFNLMENKKPYGKITALPEGSFTIWTTSLDSQGRHSVWLRGPRTKPWKGTNQQDDVNMYLEYNDTKNYAVRAVIQRASDYAKPMCFKAGYTCNGRIISEIILWQKTEVNRTSWEVRNPPMDERCELRVSGVSGTSVKIYRLKYDLISAYSAQANVSNETLSIIVPEVRQKLNKSSVVFQTPKSPDLIESSLKPSVQITTQSPDQTESSLKQSIQMTTKSPDQTENSFKQSSQITTKPPDQHENNLKQSVEITPKASDQTESSLNQSSLNQSSQITTKPPDQHENNLKQSVEMTPKASNQTESSLKQSSRMTTESPDQHEISSKQRVEMTARASDQTESMLQQSLARIETIMALESEQNGWDVTVSWKPPIRTATRYNVTLVGQHVQRSVFVPGDKTEVTIRNIQDEGFFYVILETMIGKISARTSRNAVFPEKSHLASLIIAVGVLSAIILLVAVFMFLKKRRTDKLKRSYFVDMDEKPSKDAMETFDIESSKPEENWEVGSRRLLLHEVVGEGAFGVVRRGTLGGEEVAVKMLKDFPTLDEIRSFHAEIELMKLMKTVGRHAHVLNLVECCAGRRPLILTEFCSGGDLLSYLRCIWDVMVSKRKAKYYNNNIEASEYRNDLFKCKSERQSKLVVNKLYDLQGICDTELTSRDLLSFCRQIAMGMDFLASNKVVHRDLAARNILVARDRTLKIADFGLSRDVYEENQYKQKGNGKMPVKWMALESLERKIYTTKSDIWSFGVVVWEIVTVGGSPYPDVPPARLLRFLREGYRMQKPNNCSMELYELMLSCWHAQPSARPAFSELLRRLDELLDSLCAHDYLTLEMSDDARPAPPRNRYVRMIKEKLGWGRNESYSYPSCRAPHNHYTSPPALPALQPA